ncbi:hypothetical protein HYH03_016302 [Edaphochlamys debaryana]|uniref:Uncharacterized protein n=1 Tax=Edaphochlamys debaryana TaxID=47281 RepID=A0A836BQ14_9CHLO|nr:hypothetical protein HYH03_016302 [Edaphochlamys debaryana]|eukprot:KAG2484916.1 hypothetical protein HYH03_016302 [Edaphochlamys debaryana]
MCVVALPQRRVSCSLLRPLHPAAASRIVLAAIVCFLSSERSNGKQGPTVLVYGNSAVVQDPQAAEALLSAVQQASGDGNGTAAGQFEVTQSQPLNLSSLPALHATAAYVIPFQAPAGPSYSAAEGAGDNSTAAAALTAFVKGGGNLILLGNTGQDTALSLISRVLGQPLGCQLASAQLRVRQPASAASVLPSVPRVTEVTLPIGPGAGGEGGGVGLLECSLGSGATPWLQPAADNTMRGVATTLGAPSAVTPAFVWALGRGRVVWLGATYDADTPADWVDILAAAATAPPAPPEGFTAGPRSAPLPALTPARPCVDFPETRDYNCTAWVEYPDEDFCAPDFYVPDPAGGPDLNVLRDVCPRSCGFCCADKYFECERWAVEGYCSPLYASTDPDTREEEPVPRACQNSCQVCAAQEPSSLLGTPPPAAAGQGRRRLLGRDKGKKSAGGDPTPTLPSLRKDWTVTWGPKAAGALIVYSTDWTTS